MGVERTQAMGSGTSSRVGGFGVFWYVLIAAATVLLLSSVRASQGSGMSIGFAETMKSDYLAFHAHHLLYQPVMFVLHKVLSAYGCDAMCAGQVWGIFWGMVTVVSAYALARKGLGSLVGGLLVAFFVAVSHGMLIYSSQLEPYVPMLGMITLLAAMLLVKEEPPEGWIQNLVFGVVFALSLFHHQAMVFFLIPIGYYVYSSHGRAGIRWLVKFTVVTGVSVLLVFMVVFWSTNPAPDFAGFIQWLLYYAIVSDYTHGSFLTSIGAEGLSDQRLREGIRSLTQLFVVPPPDPGGWGAGEGGFGPLQKPVRYLFALMLPTVFVWNLVQAVRGRAPNRLRVFLLVWWVTFGLFGFWWKAAVYKFFIPTLIPTILLAGLMVNEILGHVRSRSLRYVAVASVAACGGLMLYSNLNATVLRIHGSEGAIYEQARSLHRAAPEECVLYTKRYLAPQVGYYFDRVSRPFKFMFKKRVYAEIDPLVSRNIKTETDFGDHDCGVIPAFWVSREFFARETKQDFEGHLQPEDWDRFVRWFFEVEPIAGSSEISLVKFEVFEAEKGEQFLLVDRRSRMRADSLESLMHGLYELHPDGARSIFSPDTLPEVNRLRQAAFGYH